MISHPLIWAVGAVCLVLLALLFRSMGWLIRREIRFDWNIAMFAWHAFLLGGLVGAFGMLLAVARWHFV